MRYSHGTSVTSRSARLREAHANLRAQHDQAKAAESEAATKRIALEGQMLEIKNELGEATAPTQLPAVPTEEPTPTARKNKLARRKKVAA